MLAKIANDNATILNERVVCGLFASKLAPTTVEVPDTKKGLASQGPFGVNRFNFAASSLETYRT
ncbi:hypothetical protein DXU77_25190 [Pseudomonas lactis]|nr:hypothetical protein [Pseudomonas lactis]